MIIRILLAVTVLALVFAGSSLATPAGKNVEFPGGDQGKVIFNGKTHADKGLKCPDCHANPQLFQMKKGTDLIRMKNIHTSKFCGACHDGKKAFDANECNKCHRK